MNIILGKKLSDLWWKHRVLTCIQSMTLPLNSRLFYFTWVIGLWDEFSPEITNFVLIYNATGNCDDWYGKLMPLYLPRAECQFSLMFSSHTFSFRFPLQSYIFSPTGLIQYKYTDYPIKYEPYFVVYCFVEDILLYSVDSCQWLSARLQ